MPCCSSTLLRRGERNIHLPQTRRVYADPRKMLSLNCEISEILAITYEAMGTHRKFYHWKVPISSHRAPTFFFLWHFISREFKVGLVGFRV